MKYKVGMTLRRHQYMTSAVCTGAASLVKHTVVEVSKCQVKLDTSGWWTENYIDTCFLPINIIRIGGE